MVKLLEKLKGWRTIVCIALAGVVGGLKVIKTHVGMSGLPDEVFDSIITFLLGGAGLFAVAKVGRIEQLLALLAPAAKKPEEGGTK